MILEEAFIFLHGIGQHIAAGDEIQGSEHRTFQEELEDAVGGEVVSRFEKSQYPDGDEYGQAGKSQGQLQIVGSDAKPVGDVFTEVASAQDESEEGEADHGDEQ